MSSLDKPRVRSDRRLRGPARRSRLRLYLVAVGIATFGLGLVLLGTVVLGRLLVVSPGSPTPRELPPAPTRLASGELDYVALGDSYAAGPGIVPIRADPAACDRSRNNYPAYLAQALEVRSYVDVSCTGATSPDLLGSQTRIDGTIVAPQINALAPGTDLVTLTLGGNDRGAFQRIVDECPDQPRCFEVLDRLGAESPAETVSGLTGRLVAAVGRIRAASPSALVVIVGYPPAFGGTADGCESHGLSGRALQRAREYQDEVADAMAEAASRTGVVFVDLRVASAGHGICSQEPWVAGRSAAPGTGRAWHLNQTGMRMIAEVVAEAIAGPATALGAGPAQPPAGSVVMNDSSAD